MALTWFNISFFILKWAYKLWLNVYIRFKKLTATVKIWPNHFYSENRNLYEIGPNDTLWILIHKHYLLLQALYSLFIIVLIYLESLTFSYFLRAKVRNFVVRVKIKWEDCHFRINNNFWYFIAEKRKNTLNFAELDNIFRSMENIDSSHSTLQ